mmetsp:Transcript_36599/g.92450  ORF Transcript_36599/g.92450 Transcript_36599/m.92450 type:complete len:81 (+) Transcript_36599:1947-2189(+)
MPAGMYPGVRMSWASECASTPGGTTTSTPTAQEAASASPLSPAYSMYRQQHAAQTASKAHQSEENISEGKKQQNNQVEIP